MMLLWRKRRWKICFSFLTDDAFEQGTAAQLEPHFTVADRISYYGHYTIHSRFIPIRFDYFKVYFVTCTKLGVQRYHKLNREDHETVHANKQSVWSLTLPLCCLHIFMEQFQFWRWRQRMVSILSEGADLDFLNFKLSASQSRSFSIV